MAFDIFPKNAPQIIAEAAKNPLGIISLIVLTLGIVGVALFQSTSQEIKLLAFVMMTSGFLIFALLAYHIHNQSTIKFNSRNECLTNQPSPKCQAPLRFADAKRLFLDKAYDKAYAAFDEARILYKQQGDHIGETDVLVKLGLLEHKANVHLYVREQMLPASLKKRSY